MSGRFDGTSAVVTGASSGIGQATALALAEAGVERMLIHFRGNDAGAEQTVRRVAEFGCEATSVPADLSRPDDVKHLVATAFERLGTVQSWINNAGADVLTGPESELDFDAKLARLLDVDVRGTIELSRQVGDRLRGQTSDVPSSMVFIGWDQAPHGMEGDAGQMFGPVKAAVMAFSASLAQTLAPSVRVNTVAPGWIRTSWGESTSDYWDARAKGQALMHRWGRAEDVAAAVLYAADPSNTFLTGQTLEMNGGWNRRFDPHQGGRP